MPRSRLRYPAEYRRQMVELVRSGRSPDHLAREFEPSAQSIRNWVRQADRDEGLRSDDLRRHRAPSCGSSWTGLYGRALERGPANYEEGGASLLGRLGVVRRRR